ncbi:MAG: YabP/YqfC family sporulation protein [Oscillospiraceae bacterium]|nr:YabP/YqfC family sporulation protein [Oscillospiraceae bacterium]
MPRNRKAIQAPGKTGHGHGMDPVRRLGEALDLPGEMLPGFSHIEMMGNRQAIIGGVKGVLAYSETAIALNLGALVITFEGLELTIKSYQLEQVILNGAITEIRFST